VTVVFGRRFASLGGTKRPVPASRVTFFDICFTSFPSESVPGAPISINPNRC
jgi:hypothetical protein